MNKKLSMAVASAVMAFGASAANAGIVIPAGDWTLDIGGNVNTYVTETRGTGDSVVGGLAGPNASGKRSENNITTGLLPNYLSVSGKTRQNDLDVGFTISLQPGSSTVAAGKQSAQQENRQAFLTFGDKSWGTIKLGKDLGIFAGDAILNDMTLLGVGSAAGLLAGNTTTLGRIGTGFIYADWKAQASYWSPNWNGFSFTLGVTQAWNALGDGVVSTGSASRAGASPAFEGKASYEWAGDFAGKVWTSFLVQKVDGLQRASAIDVGANVNVSGFGLTGYYYDGRGIGTTVQFANAFDIAGKRRDSNGGYIQGTYTIPNVGTKIGLSWGESRLDKTSADKLNVAAGALVEKNEMWTLGVYHPLTKHLNLVAEYSDVRAEAQNSSLEGKSKTFSAGAILFF